MIEYTQEVLAVFSDIASSSLKSCHVSFLHVFVETHLNPTWKLHSGPSEDEKKRLVMERSIFV